MSTKGKMQVEQKVPEGFQKKMDREAKLTQEREKQRQQRKTQNKTRREGWLKRAEGYAKEYAAADKELIENLRKGKQDGGFFVPAESKLIIAIRIRGINNLDPWTRQTLKLLRLRQLHNAALIRVNKATIEMLRKVEPYIAYGYPSRALVKNLIYKRGYAKVNAQRIPIQSNEVIEANLGKLGITCMEDLIHEIVTVGPNFKQVNSFLCPFKLAPPRFGFKAKRVAFHNNGVWGNQEDVINDLIKRMI